jgi:hypothetical protein
MRDAFAGGVAHSEHLLAEDPTADAALRSSLLTCGAMGALAGLVEVGLSPILCERQGTAGRSA